MKDGQKQERPGDAVDSSQPVSSALPETIPPAPPSPAETPGGEAHEALRASLGKRAPGKPERQLLAAEYGRQRGGGPIAQAFASGDNDRHGARRKPASEWKPLYDQFVSAKR